MSGVRHEGVSRPFTSLTELRGLGGVIDRLVGGWWSPFGIVAFVWKAGEAHLKDVKCAGC